MKRKIIFTTLLMMVILCMFAISVSAERYDPDGATAEEYLCDASEVNRKITVKCVDIDTGKTLKTVVFHTKNKYDDICGFHLYGYDIVSFDSNQGLWETCELSWASGASDCRGAYVQICYKFITGLSKDNLDVYMEFRKSEAIKLNTNHYLLSEDGKTKSLFKTETQTIDYYDYVNLKQTAITGYKLVDGYATSLSGNFSYFWIKQTPNIPTSRPYSYNIILTDTSEDMDRWSTYHEDKQGKLDYCINITFDVEFVYELKTYTVSFDASGGSPSIGSVTKRHGGTVTIPTATPAKVGYTFQGWGTYSGDTTVNYKPGDTYSSNSNATLYAIYKKNTYTVSYSANGGSGAPSAQTKTHGVPITLSSTVPKRTGYVFLGWSTSSTATGASYSAGQTYATEGNTTLYAVWRKLKTYTVSYDANGGTSAPASQTKTEGIDLTITSTLPKNGNYIFKGWTRYTQSTVVNFNPGDIYSTDASMKLYALWRNHDLAIESLTLSETEVYKNNEISITFKATNADSDEIKTNILVDLLYNGEVIASKLVGIPANGYVKASFTINVGSSVGNIPVQVRVNWAGRTKETNPDNNILTTYLTVKEPDFEIIPEPVETEIALYTEGTTVITSYYVKNEGTKDILPSNQNTAVFTAYYYNGSGQKVKIKSITQNEVVIPGNGKNLIFFKWDVPDGLAGYTIYCECKLNTKSTMSEPNMSNNTTTLTATIKDKVTSQTPDTRFDKEAPASYNPSASIPKEISDTVKWNQWVYENGELVLKYYGITFSGRVEILPDDECKTAKVENGSWVMKSGYGITLKVTFYMSAPTGYEIPSANAYMRANSIYAVFPEYNFSSAEGCFRNLDFDKGYFVLPFNEGDADQERIHYIPIYVQDGKYQVAVYGTELWTPAGMLHVIRNSNIIMIDGSIYDEFYVGGKE